nr:hypothetical protein GCM10020092_034320 [Actinoplanes digitatis]
MTVHFEIEGFLIPGDRVAYRAMNFGQPVQDRTPFRYVLRLPIGEFTARLAQKLDQCVAELREDYEKFGDDDDATTVALAAAGWPSAAALHHDHTDVMLLVMREYLYFDILNAYAPSTGLRLPRQHRGRRRPRRRRHRGDRHGLRTRRRKRTVAVLTATHRAGAKM